VKDIVTRAVSGHATEAMQRHYSTVTSQEVREGVGRVISLMKYRELVAAPHAAPGLGGVQGGVQEDEKRKAG
jgi:hypothetical protein